MKGLVEFFKTAWNGDPIDLFIAASSVFGVAVWVYIIIKVGTG